VPPDARAGYVRTRLHGLAVQVLLGSVGIVSSVAAALASGGAGGSGLELAGIAASLVLNYLLFLAAFRLLCSDPAPTPALRPGALMAAVFWEALQLLGGVYVGQVIRGASAVGGLFVFVIGLLAWLHLAALGTIYAAEVNVVVSRSLWPRSLVKAPTAPAYGSAPSSPDRYSAAGPSRRAG
jgi:uncharacterized BrkB/YihY/UPF0761 family membrane protein